MPGVSKAICVATAMWVLALVSVGAQDFALTQEEYAKLPPKAQAYYRAGMDHLDHVREQMALKSFVMAAEAAPKNVEIRFLVGKLGEWTGRKARFDEAVELYETAKKAYDQIVAMGVDAIGRPTVRRAQTRSEQVAKLISQQAEVDAKRQKIGEQVLNAHLKDIGYER